MQYNHLVGTIYNVPYDTLVQVFGDPDPMAFDPCKSDAGWTTTDSDGKKISIYNWKNGPNYCGPAGIPVKEIVQWNIGGTSSDDVTLVKRIIREGVHVFTAQESKKITEALCAWIDDEGEDLEDY